MVRTDWQSDLRQRGYRLTPQRQLVLEAVDALEHATPDDILTADFSFIDRTGLKEHLAPTRANALNLMAVRMRQLALGFAGK